MQHTAHTANGRRRTQCRDRSQKCDVYLCFLFFVFTLSHLLCRRHRRRATQQCKWDAATAASKQANNNKMAKRIVFGSGRRLHCTFSHSSQEMAKNPWNIRGGCCAGMEMPFGECVCGVNWFFAIFAKVCRVCVNVICTTQQQQPTNTIEMQWQ